MARWYDLGLEKPDKTLHWKLLKDESYREFAVISDLHFGNMWQQKTLLNNFIKICQERSIETLLCAGDVVDGTMTFKEHSQERFLHCADSYLEYCEENYPSGFSNVNGLILGNHDKSLTLYENPNYDFCKELCKVRKDLTYHKANDINVTKPFTLPGNINVLMYHGSNCTNPEFGQKRKPRLQQKTAELLSNTNFDLVMFGHCHRTCLTNFMNAYAIGLGCFCADTPFQVNRGTFGDVCGLIVKYVAEKGKIVCLEPEFFSADQLGGIKKRDF